MPFHKRIFGKNKISKNTILLNISKRNLAFNIEDHFYKKGYKLHLLEQGPSQTVELSKEAGLKYYRQMNIIRKMEHECSELYKKKTIRGFCHLYSGEESVAVGIYSSLRPQDTVIAAYRCHGWAALMCDSLTAIFAELIGHVSGVARGKGGSMHLYANNFYGGNGIVGAHVPVGVGIALTHKFSGHDAVSVALYGDGAANQGQVFEAYNIAKLQMLPMIFVIENNNYGMGTATDRSAANPEHYRQSAYIPGIRLNGNDILAVSQATKFALNHIHEGKGPILLEMMTYRYSGHSMSDPGTAYRSREEVQEVRKRKDPIKNLALLLVESNLATEEEMKKIKDDAQKEIRQALEKALKDNPPAIEELYGDCYASYPAPIRTSRMLTYHPHKHFGKYNVFKK